MRLPLLLKSFVIPLTWIILFTSFSYASDKPLERKGLTPVGEIIFVAGKALVRLIPEESYRPAVSRQELVSGDIIKTAPDGRLSILFRDETQLKLASNTTLMIKAVTPHKEKSGALKILLRLESGEVWTRSKGVPDGLMIETPYATAAIRGTEWGLSVKDNESRVIVMEGSVQFSNPVGSITVERNEQAVVVGREVPVKSMIIRPRDRTQWTLYLTEKRLLGYLKFKEGVLGKAEVLFNEGRLDESAKAFEEILSTEPENSLALIGLGLIELKKGNIEKAGEYFDKSLKIERALLALLGKSYQFISINRTEEAAAMLLEAKESFPKDPLSNTFLSYLYTFRGDFPGALDECDKGLSAIPNHPLLLAFKIDIYFILDKLEEVRLTIETLLKENPESSEGYERLGFYHRIVTGDSKKATEAFQRSIQLDHLNDEALAKLADLLREQGYIPEALQLIEHALSISPWNAMHHYNYGRLLADINQIDRARAEFRKSSELDSTFSRAYLGEGVVLLKEGKTDAALRELSKASLLEPNLSEIHSFLAIAYYQKHEVKAAIDELKRAEECDSLDSTPHQLASMIYKDLYMPAEAIEEAKKVLALLPYRKASGEALLESAKSGTMSVNYGLDFFELLEWSLYYAEKALFLNPYSNNSHYGISMAYDKLSKVNALQGYDEYFPAFSEQLQARTLNVNSLNYSNRYRTLINKPGHYLTLGGTYGGGDSEEKQVDLDATGDFGSRFPLTYWIYSRAYRDDGHLENSKYENGHAGLVLGYKPNYEHDIYLDLYSSGYKVGVTPAASLFSLLGLPDHNQEHKIYGYWFNLGYHRRISPESHVITNLRYFGYDYFLKNPDYERDLFGFAEAKQKQKNFAFAIRHMFTLHEDHQLSYGVDYNLTKFDSHSVWPLSWPPSSEFVRAEEYFLTKNSLILHLYDRWAIHPKITLDTGLFFSYYSPESHYYSQDPTYGSSVEKMDKTEFSLNPKLGIAVNLGKNGVFRIAYQKRSTPGFDGELAPVGTSGLIPPSFNFLYNAAQDIQTSIEYELTERTFIKTSLGYERLKDLIAAENLGKAQLWYGRVAINQILGRHFSFSTRYNYNNSRYLDGAKRELRGIPRHSGDARLVFIHPAQIKMWLREAYVGEMFTDSQNRVKLKGYFLTDFYAQKEFFKKRISLSFSVLNLFDKRYLAVSHPYYWYEGALPAKGRTFLLQMEYRL